MYTILSTGFPKSIALCFGYLDSSTYAWPVAINLRCCDPTLGLSYLCFRLLFILPTLARQGEDTVQGHPAGLRRG